MILQDGRRGFDSRANFAGDKKLRACRMVETRGGKKQKMLLCGSRGLGKVIRMPRPVFGGGFGGEAP